MLFVGATYATSGTIAPPSGYQAGDELYLYGLGSTSVPAGWTKVGTDTSSRVVATRSASGTSSDNVSLTSAGYGRASITAWRGAGAPLAETGDMLPQSASPSSGHATLTLPASKAPLIAVFVTTVFGGSISADAGLTQDSTHSFSPAGNYQGELILWGHDATPASSVTPQADLATSSFVEWWGQAIATVVAGGGLTMWM